MATQQGGDQDQQGKHRTDNRQEDAPKDAKIRRGEDTGEDMKSAGGIGSGGSAGSPAGNIGRA